MTMSNYIHITLELTNNSQSSLFLVYHLLMKTQAIDVQYLSVLGLQTFCQKVRRKNTNILDSINFFFDKLIQKIYYTII